MYENSERTRRLLDEFSQRRHVTYAQAVVPMASRRDENVKFEVLALRRKHEYFPFQFAKSRSKSRRVVDL